MNMNEMGRTGVMVSELCLGTMTFGTQTSESDGHRQIDTALDGGINFIDTAEMYPVNPISQETVGRTEEIVGNWIAANRSRRAEIVLATKHAGEGFAFARDGAPISKATITQTIEGSIDELRDMAHYASDVIFENLTGIEGAFSTRIMYVTATGPLDDRSFQLNIADADGHRIKTVLQSREPILSATWAPDGNRIAYQSFEKDSRPAIYIADLTTGARQQITDFEGLNGAPAFSPDGKSLAMVLSKDGSPDIYVLDIETRRLRRITRHYGIDTEPSWTPDGKAIIFTSSRGGKPQIYQMTLRDLSIERLTFEGDYNAKASILPDGSGIIMVHRREGIYHIALFDMNRGRISVLTETSLDESPSIAPNGSMLIYATQVNNNGILAAVSVDSRVKFNLPSSEGDVREPAWSPKKRMTFTPISQ